ncbi:MAG: hypothetical protein EHM20_00790 [Alphaproteobacteria bacterium]|nr:MAG: hypothetical protein EHM20_00790 [Alphaproteobacteria bacterium]
MEYITGEEVLSDSIGPSKDIEANIMLTESEMVTIVFKTTVQFPSSESLNVAVADPQNREYSWVKKLDASDKPNVQKIDFFSFTPEASGMHHVKISNADFQTEVKIVSGMISPTEQPSYLVALLAPLIILIAGIFLFRGIRMGSRGFSLSGALNFFISLSISLIIVRNVVGL